MRTTDRLSVILIIWLSLPVPRSFVPNAWGAERLWKAGLGTADITPAEPIWLAGYAARTKPSEGVAHPINAKALALEDPQGKKLIIITSDILGFTRQLSDPIA